MEVGEVIENSPCNDTIPETSDLSSNADVRELDDKDMVIEESPVKEQASTEEPCTEETTSPFASPSYSDRAVHGSSKAESPRLSDENESLGALAVDTKFSPSPEHSEDVQEPEGEHMEVSAETEERILDLTEEGEDIVEEMEDMMEEDSQIVNSAVDKEEEIVDREETEETLSFDTAPVELEEEAEDQILDNTAEEEQCEDEEKVAETEDTQTVDPETHMHSVVDGHEETFFSEDATESPVHSDAEILSPSVDEPEQAGPASPELKCPSDAENSEEKETKEEEKESKDRASEASVPTVTVTAPSDQSDESETEKPSSTALSPSVNLPKRIENTDKLPPGWRRVAVQRLSGKFVGRYDTTLFSDTNYKMRSLPNVRHYLETTGQLHLLDVPAYDFKFCQPFSTPREKATKRKSSTPASKSKTPTSSSVKVAGSKTPTSSSKAAKSKACTTNQKKNSKSDTPTTTKVCMTLKRKVPVGTNGSDSQSGGSGSPDFSNIWEVKKPPKAKARKKTTVASKKDSPQLKLDAFIARMKPSQAPKESRFKSSFKTVLHNTPPIKKEVKKEVEMSAAYSVETVPRVVPSEKSPEKSETVVDLAETVVDLAETVVDLAETEVDLAEAEVDSAQDVEETEQNAEEAVLISDEETNNADEEGVSGVYLAEEQEEPYRSDEEDDTCVPDDNTGDTPMEFEGAGDEANKDAISEKCPSEETSVFELKSEESDTNSVATPTPESLLQETVVSNDSEVGDSVTSKPLSTAFSRIPASKRSLSPSDSDISTRKQARIWREADIEEDSSRSVGMCSDTSLPPQEEDENQNMASKVQKMHLSDSSSSKDMKDSASTSSSNCSSLALSAALLSPLWKKSKAKSARDGHDGSSRRRIATRKALLSPDAHSAAIVSMEKSSTVKTNGATGSVAQVKMHRDLSWSPPRSPFNLIQERLCHDPWKMLVATIFLCEVEAEVAIPLLWKFLNRWPSAEQVQAAETEHIARLLNPMKRNETCAATVVHFSEEFLTKDWKYPIELHGIEKYGNDSYRIFCIKEWKEVTPDDERLASYCQWLEQNSAELGVE